MARVVPVAATLVTLAVLLGRQPTGARADASLNGWVDFSEADVRGELRLAPSVQAPRVGCFHSDLADPTPGDRRRRCVAMFWQRVGALAVWSSLTSDDGGETWTEPETVRENLQTSSAAASRLDCYQDEGCIVALDASTGYPPITALDVHRSVSTATAENLTQVDGTVTLQEDEPALIGDPVMSCAWNLTDGPLCFFGALYELETAGYIEMIPYTFSDGTLVAPDPLQVPFGLAEVDVFDMQCDPQGCAVVVRKADMVEAFRLDIVDGDATAQANNFSSIDVNVTAGATVFSGRNSLSCTLGMEACVTVVIVEEELTGGGYASRVKTARSSDGGRSWEDFQLIADTADFAPSPDDVQVDCGLSCLGTGHICVAVWRTGPCVGDDMGWAVSENGGATWSAPQTVEDTNSALDPLCTDSADMSLSCTFGETLECTVAIGPVNWFDNGTETESIFMIGLSSDFPIMCLYPGPPGTFPPTPLPGTTPGPSVTPGPSATPEPTTAVASPPGLDGPLGVVASILTASFIATVIVVALVVIRRRRANRIDEPSKDSAVATTVSGDDDSVPATVDVDLGRFDT